MICTFFPSDPGINGTITAAQRAAKIPDSPEAFLKDTVLSSKLQVETYELAEVLTSESGPAIDWLIKAFNLDLSILGRMGGHSFPRTHRGKEKFPGMTITYALMEKLEKIAETDPKRAKVIVKAKVTELVTDSTGAVVGCKYEHQGKTFTEDGPIIIASGGYGADYEADSLLKQFRPDILDVATTCGSHCTGDGIKMAMKIGAGTKDMTAVQVHPTGLVHPDEPDAKVKFLAAEAMRGCGALILNPKGERFCNELGRRDYVSGEMNSRPGQHRLVLNGAASNEISWHCKHYVGRKLMKKVNSGAELAKEFGISPSDLQKTFDAYNAAAAAGKDEFGKNVFPNAPMKMDDFFHVSMITPVRHYTMGGLLMSGDAEVMKDEKTPLKGLFATGEVMGGTHGLNRLGGSSLLDCVVFGRVSGRSASRYQLNQLLSGGASVGGKGGKFNVTVDPASNQVTVNWGSSSSSSSSSQPEPASSKGLTAADAANDWQDQKAPAAAKPAGGTKEYTLDDVAKHKTEEDCWVVVNGQVLDVSKFMHEHPGGKQALMLFAGRDATEEFNMLHKPDVVAKYAPDTVLGTLKGAKVAAKL